MRSEIRRLHETLGITTVYVTHDQGEALVTSDRIVVMYDGSLQQVGPPEEIYESPATEFVARFIGRCNILTGTLLPSGQVDVGGVLIESKSQAAGIKTGSEVALTLRPHSIKMEATPSNGHPANRPAEVSEEGLASLRGSVSNRYTALVEHQVYLGEYREYRVRLENSPITLSVITPPTNHFSPGEQVFVSLPPESCRLVPRTPKMAGAIPEEIQLESTPLRA